MRSEEADSPRFASMERQKFLKFFAVRSVFRKKISYAKILKYLGHDEFMPDAAIVSAYDSRENAD
jgi:hypothetical protein